MVNEWPEKCPLFGFQWATKKIIVNFDFLVKKWVCGKSSAVRNFFAFPDNLSEAIGNHETSSMQFRELWDLVRRYVSCKFTNFEIKISGVQPKGWKFLASLLRLKSGTEWSWVKLELFIQLSIVGTEIGALLKELSISKNMRIKWTEKVVFRTNNKLFAGNFSMKSVGVISFWCLESAEALVSTSDWHCFIK